VSCGAAASSTTCVSPPCTMASRRAWFSSVAALRTSASRLARLERAKSGLTMVTASAIRASTTNSSSSVKPPCELLPRCAAIAGPRVLEPGVLQQLDDIREAVAEGAQGFAVALVAAQDLRAQDDEQFSTYATLVGVGKQAAEAGHAHQAGHPALLVTFFFLDQATERDGRLVGHHDRSADALVGEGRVV